MLTRGAPPKPVWLVGDAKAIDDAIKADEAKAGADPSIICHIYLGDPRRP